MRHLRRDGEKETGGLSRRTYGGGDRILGPVLIHGFSGLVGGILLIPPFTSSSDANGHPTVAW